MSPNRPPDTEIVAAVLDGDASRYEEIVSRYEIPLWRAAYSRVQRTDWADEIVQETLLCAFKYLHTYKPEFTFRTWLWTILLNQCRRAFNQASRDAVVWTWTDQQAAAGLYGDEKLAGIADEADSPQTHALNREQSETLASLLSELPEAQADALRLRFYGGLKFSEIADATNCSLSTAKNRVRSGLEKMSHLLTSRGLVDSR